ncbi:MAG: 50S ribosomal protein L21 [Candidatus Dependentiae bacterium]
MENITTFDKYAIIKTGGKQYQAIEGKTIAIEKLPQEAGSSVEFAEVLFRKNGEGQFEVGRPFLTGSVKATILKHIKGDKVVSLRFKRRKKVRVQKNHRQEMTIVRVVSI